MSVPPVIIVGMHRSGTTMITKMLEGLGLFVGDQKEINHEALFFWNINNWIFELTHSRADLPHNFRYLNPRTREIILQDLNYFVRSRKKKLFLGNKYNAYSSIKELDFPWGWKDPKNSFTIELWKEVFPNARVLHIYRNPIDSIQSFIKRDLEMKNRYELNWKKKLKRFFLISRNYHSNFRLFSLEEGYNLWEEYVIQCLSLEKDFPDMMHICYEDFLEQPAEYLKTISDFCGLRCEEADIRKQVKFVKSDRRYAFTGNSEAIQVYLNIKDKPLMKTLQYDNIITEST